MGQYSVKSIFEYTVQKNIFFFGLYTLNNIRYFTETFT